MKPNYKTARLFLRPMNADDAAFIYELVNTPGWIKFIGDRNVKNTEDAGNYILKITSNPGIAYRVVTLLDTKTAIGIVTFIKRDYLDHPDIGFAFLPAYSKQGYAFEASKEILQDLLKMDEHRTILATTIPENSSSVHLLKKLGFSFSREFSHEGLVLQLYAITKNL
ncbi:MAG: GNAT family N-acetyltransferase [Ferruginibacter sp.]